MAQETNKIESATFPFLGKADAHDFEITPKMIEAGVLAAREHCLGESLDELVRKVFWAMIVEIT
jgi:hypothetical protein